VTRDRHIAERLQSIPTLPNPKTKTIEANQNHKG